MVEFEKRLSQYPELVFGVRLARQIARVVYPVYGLKQNDVPLNEISHDFNYALDIAAEKAVKKSFEKAQRKGFIYGYVTEDQGLNLPTQGQPNWNFLIDPVDGSRPANIGAENACVNIAIVPGHIENPTLGNVEMGVVFALKERLMYVVKKNRRCLSG